MQNVADTAALDEFEKSRIPTRRSERHPSTHHVAVRDDDDDDDDTDSSEPMIHMAMSAISGMQQTSDTVITDETTRRAVAAGVRSHVKHQKKQYRRLPTPTAAEISKFADARQAEYDACIRQKVWTEMSVADLPPHANVLPVKWVDKEKSDGRLKSRITPKGFRQKHGIDYFETFASTAMYKTLRLMLSLVAMWDYELVQMDVPEAFLNAELDEEVYMQMPPGYEKPSTVLRLLKSLYGLCQSPRNWGKLIHGFVTNDLGFQCNRQRSEFVLETKSNRSIDVTISIRR